MTDPLTGGPTKEPRPPKRRRRFRTRKARAALADGAVSMPGQRPVRSRGIYLLPNALTTAALFCGFFTIVQAMNNHFEQAAIAIFVAMVLDDDMSMADVKPLKPNYKVINGMLHFPWLKSTRLYPEMLYSLSKPILNLSRIKTQ